MWFERGGRLVEFKLSARVKATFESRKDDAGAGLVWPGSLPAQFTEHGGPNADLCFRLQSLHDEP